MELAFNSKGYLYCVKNYLKYWNADSDANANANANANADVEMPMPRFPNGPVSQSRATCSELLV